MAAYGATWPFATGLAKVGNPYLMQSFNGLRHHQMAAPALSPIASDATPIVGRENVIAGTDCGLGGRVHADLAWAKLRTLVEGARPASTSLWP
jgi:5-methyltetrahydropteroyltriglutamate--homocysteine methyltransferase